MEPSHRAFLADRGDHGTRLDRVLVRHLADLGTSRVAVARWVRDGKVRVGELAVARPAQRVWHGERVVVELPPPDPAAPVLLAQPIALAVLYEDEHLLALDKPPGLVVHPTWGHRDGTVLNGLLWRAQQWSAPGQRPRLLHRLDRGTSGVLLVAKSAAAQRSVARAWQRREVRKEYLAVVAGRPPAARGRIDLPIARDPAEPKRRCVEVAGGRPSVTLWEVEAEAQEPAVAVLRCRPLSGRTHQIRVHLAARGMPILGDPLYGRPSSGSEQGSGEPTGLLLARQALHAAALVFTHPVDGAELRIESPMPADLRALLAGCGLGVA